MELKELGNLKNPAKSIGAIEPGDIEFQSGTRGEYGVAASDGGIGKIWERSGVVIRESIIWVWVCLLVCRE